MKLRVPSFSAATIVTCCEGRCVIVNWPDAATGPFSSGFGSALTYGPLAAYLPELFPEHVRYSGSSMAYQLAAIVVSGGTPFLMASLLAATKTSASVSAFIFAMGCVTFLCALRLPETAGAKSASGPGQAERETESAAAGEGYATR